jgi:hypothetical protein
VSTSTEDQAPEFPRTCANRLFRAVLLSGTAIASLQSMLRLPGKTGMLCDFKELKGPPCFLEFRGFKGNHAYWPAHFLAVSNRLGHEAKHR